MLTTGWLFAHLTLTFPLVIWYPCGVLSSLAVLSDCNQVQIGLEAVTALLCLPFKRENQQNFSLRLSRRPKLTKRNLLLILVRALLYQWMENILLAGRVTDYLHTPEASRLLGSKEGGGEKNNKTKNKLV